MEWFAGDLRENLIGAMSWMFGMGTGWLLHGFKMGVYKPMCNLCEGSGKMPCQPTEFQQSLHYTCPACEGTGRGYN